MKINSIYIIILFICFNFDKKMHLSSEPEINCPLDILAGSKYNKITALSTLPKWEAISIKG